MKKLFTLIVLITGLCNAQRFREEYVTLNIIVDPVASIKEQGSCFGAEIEAVSQPLYIRGAITVFPQLKGGYLELGAAIGLTTYIDKWDKTSIYGGIRMGIINRGSYPYPTVGFESGLDYNISDNVSIGGRITYDYRSDWEYWGGQADWRQSGFIKLAYKFN